MKIRSLAMAITLVVAIGGCSGSSSSPAGEGPSAVQADAAGARAGSAAPSSRPEGPGATTLVGDTTCPSIVNFRGDAAVEQAVRTSLKQVGRSGEGEVVEGDLASIVLLNLSRAKIDNLDACLYPALTGTRDLFLGPGNVEDISLLSSLTQLQGLQIYVNHVSDITPLSGMTKLVRLDLERTLVQNLEPISKLTELVQLQIDDTPVKDITPLAGLTKLEKLSMRNTKVTDLSPLKNLGSLRTLLVEGTHADTAMLQRTGLKIVLKGRI